MIESFIDSAIIIDDTKEDIVGLQAELAARQILNEHYFPEQLLQSKLSLKNRKVIFLDLYINPSENNIAGQISMIRQLFQTCIGTEFGAYGIVLWTKHTDDIQEFFKRFYKSADRYTLPLFIVYLDKSKYKLAGNYSDLFLDLQNALIQDTASNFFIQWDTIVRKGKDSSIKSIYSLIKDHEKRDENLKYILFQLAKNHSGVPFEAIGANNYPIYKDSFKAINDILEYEINKHAVSSSDFFGPISEISYSAVEPEIKDLGEKVDATRTYKKIAIKKGNPPEQQKDKWYAGNEQIESSLLSKLEREIQDINSSLNFKLHFDNSNLTQSEVIPGNIYEVMDLNNPVIISKEHSPTNSIPVIIELTPPCDYSQLKRIKARFIGGFLDEFSKSKLDDYNKGHHYREIYPIKIDGEDKIKLLVFDFRYFGALDLEKLQDASQYKIILKTKDRLFADILQKYSAYSARLGLSIMH